MFHFDGPVAKGCTSYRDSNVYRARSTVTYAGPRDNWIDIIESAPADTEILLEDGDYFLDRYAVVVKDDVTVRSHSGQRNNVRIRGQGYGVGSEGFMVTGNNVTIADMSIYDIRDHAISVKPQIGGKYNVQIFNVKLYDIGTQHIKIDEGGAQSGLIACSRIGYTNVAVGDYIGAIDMHGTIDWVIRDNYIHDITGDGSGCAVDEHCGVYISTPAILVWRGASGTQVLRNDIVNSFRNIAFGFGSSHTGGLIQGNAIRQESPGDAGIELFGANGTHVENNVVQLGGRYPGAIEYRASKHLVIRDNRLSRPPWNRGGNENITLLDNIP